MDDLARYKALDYELPDTNLAWRMREAGVDNFGKQGWDSLPLVKPKHDEVLLRVDAIGICFSDVKLITQGSAHPRIRGRDMVNEPVTPGHEVSLTVVEAGEDYADKYKPGDRFMVQADVYFRGVNLAFGYALSGGMQQYCIVGEPVLAGDEGSYLIPVKPQTGYAEAALVEPWTCVVAAYRIRPRKTLKPGGIALVVGTDNRTYTIHGSACKDGSPAKLICAGVPEGGLVAAEKCPTCSAEVCETGKLTPETLKALREERTGDKGFDDIIVLGTPDADLAEALAASLAKNGVMAIAASQPMSRPIKVDFGRVHYDYTDLIGTTTTDITEAYSKSRGSELKEGGTAWIVGGAGAMGQMHTQRAAKMKNGPKKILVTDADNHRIDCLKASVAEDVKANGIEIVYINPVEAGMDAVDKAIWEMTDGKGFDDIVMTAAVLPVMEGSIKYLAEDGLMNIFAGFPIGTIGELDLGAIYLKGNRFVGSSGSRPQDMIDTLALTENGDLPVENSMAAVGGIDAMAEGVRAVKEARFPGKTVIFPQINLPLTALVDLDKVAPTVFAKLKDGKFWTKEAEEELLRSRLEL